LDNNLRAKANSAPMNMLMTAAENRTEVCELGSLALIRFTGADARAFLHNQLTCDVEALTPQTSTYGSYCTPKGRMLATFLLWRSGDDYFMQLPLALREQIQKRLSTFILRSKVKAIDATAEWVSLGVSGRSAAALARLVSGEAPAAIHGVTHGKDAIVVIRLPGERFEFVVPAAKAQSAKELLAHQAEVTDEQYWYWLDIRAGIPMVTAATQEEFVPQMANLDLIGAVSFTKGCYPGQEIVARMHYRGTLKQRMYRASAPEGESPHPGDKLYSPQTGSQSCGMIVNAAPAPDDIFDVLAVMQITAAEGGDVHLGALEGPQLELQPLPYKITAD
jgi:tRNA-modifying protein YgfZ